MTPTKETKKERKWDIVRRKLYNFIEQYIKREWYSPTYKEMSKYIWVYESVVFSHIKKLIDKKMLSKDKRWCLYISLIPHGN